MDDHFKVEKSLSKSSNQHTVIMTKYALSGFRGVKATEKKMKLFIPLEKVISINQRILSSKSTKKPYGFDITFQGVRGDQLVSLAFVTEEERDNWMSKIEETCLTGVLPANIDGIVNFAMLTNDNDSCSLIDNSDNVIIIINNNRRSVYEIRNVVATTAPKSSAVQPRKRKSVHNPNNRYSKRRSMYDVLNFKNTKPSTTYFEDLNSQEETTPIRRRPKQGMVQSNSVNRLSYFPVAKVNSSNSRKSLFEMNTIQSQTVT
eukprot:Pgem_evm1s15565